MTRPHPPVRRVFLLVTAVLGGAVCSSVSSAAAPVVAAVPASVTPLIEGLSAGPLTAPVTGQAVYVVDEAAGGVVGFDPFQPRKRWAAIEAGRNAGERPAAIACIDSSHLAVVRRIDGDWLLQTFRLPAPGGQPPAAAPHASSRVGPVAPGDLPLLTVGFARDWLAITGLAAPLPHLLAYRIRGAQPAQELRRDPPGSSRFLAAASAPDDTLVLLSTEHSQPAAAARLSIRRPTDMRPLLELDTGLPNARAAAFGRSDGTLWVLAGDSSSAATPAGLWRIDAILRNGRQAARAVCLARIDSARSLAWISDRMILVAHGSGTGGVLHIDPSQARLGEDASR